jgi:molybdopterin converting factor small subunit
MKVTVEFLSLPNVVKMIGSKSVTLDFEGGTIDELIGEVTAKYGKQVREFLLDETGRLDANFRVVLNKQEWLDQDQLDRAVQDGDIVTIAMLVGGG